MSNEYTSDDNSQILKSITAQVVDDAKRLDALPRHFGRAMLRVEHTIYNFLNQLCADYQGGYWEFYELSNGGFYMAPRTDRKFFLQCENGFSRELSGDAAGIVACLYAFSHMAFAEPSADNISTHFHHLRDFACEHADAALIFAAID